MLDARYVADRVDEVRAALLRRSAEAAAGLDAIADLSAQRRRLIAETETKQAARNAANQRMAELARGGDKAEFAARREELKSLGVEVKRLEEALARVENDMAEQLVSVPNIPHSTTPDGRSAEDNPVVRTWGEKPQFDFDPAAHWDIGARLGIIDFDRAAK